MAWAGKYSALAAAEWSTGACSVGECILVYCHGVLCVLSWCVLCVSVCLCCVPVRICVWVCARVCAQDLSG